MEGLGGVDGLVSGLPTGDLVDAMVASDAQATAKLEQRKLQFEAKLEGVQGFNTRLLSAQVDLVALKNSDTFNARTVTSSNTSAMTATATADASVGSYQISDVVMAKAHQLATAGQASDSTSLGTGTVTVQLGNGTQKVLDFSSGGSLNDIAQGINDADINISAFVTNDGSANPYRLVLQSEKTGLANTISISGTGDFNSIFLGGNMTTLENASDASFKLGTGGALTITSDSNTIDDAIPGLSLQLAGDVTGSLSLNVGTDTTGAVEAIETFVGSVNEAISYLNDNTSFDPDTGQSGILLSESDMRRSIDGIVRELFNPVEGLATQYSTVGSLGLALDRNSGEITIDKAKLQSAVAADPNAVANLFTNSGESDTSGIAFAAMNDKTDPTAGFAVAITQVALQATSTGTIDLAATTTLTSSNNALAMNINGSNYLVTFATGSYTRTELAEHMETVINEAVDPPDRVDIDLSGDKLQMKSKLHGSAQTFKIDPTSSSLSDIYLDTSQVTGQDVAGTINGAAANGIGQVLQGASGTTAEGLNLIISATSTVSGTVTARKGLGQLLSDKLVGQTNGQTGAMTQKEDGFQAIIEDMDEQIGKLESRLEQRRLRYQSQFVALEKILAQFQSQENFLAGQLDAFANMAASASGRG